VLRLYSALARRWHYLARLGKAGRLQADACQHACLNLASLGGAWGFANRSASARQVPHVCSPAPHTAAPPHATKLTSSQLFSALKRKTISGQKLLYQP